MSVVLSEHLPLLASAPEGIKKLRGLILELAVRGKLVPQDPDDEPASELLKRIAAGRSRLELDGTIKKSKPLLSVSKSDGPFVLPESWGWVRLGTVLEMINGRAFKPTDWLTSGLPIVRIQNLNKLAAPFNYCDPTTVDERHRLCSGDFLISWSGTPGTSFGAFIWERGDAALNQHIFRCLLVGDGFSKDFLKLGINSQLEVLIAQAQGGVGLQHVTKGTLEALALPLPPLAEQHRIVAKVDELMALCDRLETEQSDAEIAHARLVETLLGTLTQSADADELGANWQLLVGHFDTLFTTDASLNALKQTVLQLAVMGKLVPQEPIDEPAVVLLNQISIERARLERNGLRKKTKELLPVGEEEKSFTLPQCWEWTRLGSISLTSTGKTPATSNADFYGGAIPFIGPGQLTIDGRLLPPEKWLSVKGMKETPLADAGDVLMVCIGGSIGKCVITDRELAFNQQINCAKALLMSSEYLFAAMKTEGFQRAVLAASSGSATPIINGSKWAELVVPLPPLAEQHRIVAKVDELMALCDRLKADLAESRGLEERLAATLIESALAA